MMRHNSTENLKPKRPPSLRIRGQDISQSFRERSDPAQTSKKRLSHPVHTFVCSGAEVFTRSCPFCQGSTGGLDTSLSPRPGPGPSFGPRSGTSPNLNPSQNPGLGPGQCHGPSQDLDPRPTPMPAHTHTHTHTHAQTQTRPRPRPRPSLGPRPRTKACIATCILFA